MCIDEVSGFGSDVNEYDFEYSSHVLWNNRDVSLMNEEDSLFGKTFFSDNTKPISSVGGSISAEREKDGSSEITAEVHVSTKSDDGNTSVTASGEASVDNTGSTSGKVEVKVEYEF